MLNTQIKRGNLRKALAASTTVPTTTLKAKLESYLTTATDGTATGRLIAQTAANGHSTSYFEPNAGSGVTIEEAIELWEELITLLEQVTADIGGTPSDAVVFAEMMGRLVPPYELERTYSGLRVCV